MKTQRNTFSLDITPVDSIVVGSRLRELDPTKVAAIKQSISEIGLQTPITVWCEPDGDNTIPHLVMRRADIADGLWTLPKELVKPKRANEVPLSTLARSIIDDMDDAGEFVFSTVAKGAKAVNGFSKAKAELDRVSEVADWRFHDIRRTVATGMAELGVSPYVVEKVLNHSSGTFKGVLRVYNRYEYIPEKKKALQLWAEYVQGLLDGQRDKVVSLHG